MSVTAARGFRAAGIWAGLKGSGKPDLSLIVSDRPAAAAGIFTTNRFCSPSVLLTRDRLTATRGRARAIVGVSGCSNAMTGRGGLADARRITGRAARLLAIPPAEVLFGSTGPIGPRFPVARIERGLGAAVRVLASTPAASLAAARGIFTTDKKTKQATATFRAGGVTHRVGGIAKGVGMVSPKMATVLVFITSDARVPVAGLRRALPGAAHDTLNAISVDGQMSTSDTLLVLANGAAGGPALTGAGLRAFGAALHDVCAALARELVADGEGATRLFRVTVRGGRTPAQAERAARAVADSALVKTMFYGRQANWGRIGQALGACGVPFDPMRVTVSVGGVAAIRGGRVLPAGLAAASAMAESEVPVLIDLRAGRATATVLTCDLTEGYIRENASYLS